MELHDAVIYGFPYKLRPKPKIASLDSRSQTATSRLQTRPYRQISLRLKRQHLRGYLNTRNILGGSYRGIIVDSFMNAICLSSRLHTSPRGPPRRVSAYEISKSTGFQVDFGFQNGFRISEWISGFQSGFLDFKVDFWISKWISGFQSGFLDFKADFWISKWISRGISGFQSGFLDFKVDFSKDFWVSSEFLDFKADFWISFEPLLIRYS